MSAVRLHNISSPLLSSGKYQPGLPGQTLGITDTHPGVVGDDELVVL